MVVYVDTREKEYEQSWMITHGNVVITKLDIGDYSATDKCGNTLYIERKKIEDLFSSISSDRFDRQMKNMSTKDLTMLVISGDIDNISDVIDLSEERIKSILKHAIINSVIRYSIRSIVWLKTNEEALEFILSTCEDFEKNTVDKHPAKRVRGNTRKHNLLRSITGIPHDTATELLNKYKSIGNILKTEDEELLKYSGMGKIRIKNMRELFD